jgi:archaellum component FlaC
VSEVKQLKDRIEMLEIAVDLLQERLDTLMSEQHFEPYIVQLSDEDANKIKHWLKSEGI